MTQPEVRVSVQDFGPIAEAAIDLRPLTVFVGPSNTGKTYLATLIYALHRASEGFGRMPPRADLATEPFRWMDSEIVDRLNDEVREKILRVGTEFTSGDLPQQVREEFARMLGPVVGQLEAELERCFDVESCSELIRAEGSGGSLRVSLDVREAERSLWHVRMDVSRQPESSGEGEINDDVVLLPTETSLLERMDLASKLRRAPGALFEALMEHARWTGQVPRARHLPAARSGMVQSHRVIASSLVARSTRANSKRAAELPTMSGVMADFMECLILYDEGKSRKKEIRDLADALEHDPLFGEIRARRPLPGGFPEFVYRPRGTTQDIRFSRASSMVTELARRSATTISSVRAAARVALSTWRKNLAGPSSCRRTEPDAVPNRRHLHRQAREADRRRAEGGEDSGVRPADEPGASRPEAAPGRPGEGQGLLVRGSVATSG